MSTRTTGGRIPSLSTAVRWFCRKNARKKLCIDGEKRMDIPGGYVEVRFDGLEVFIYWSQGQPQVGAKATGIHLVTKS